MPVPSCGKGVLGPWPGIEPRSYALGAWCPKWDTREVPTVVLEASRWFECASRVENHLIICCPFSVHYPDIAMSASLWEYSTCLSILLQEQANSLSIIYGLNLYFPKHNWFMLIIQTRRNVGFIVNWRSTGLSFPWLLGFTFFSWSFWGEILKKKNGEKRETRLG